MHPDKATHIVSWNIGTLLDLSVSNVHFLTPLPTLSLLVRNRSQAKPATLRLLIFNLVAFYSSNLLWRKFSVLLFLNLCRVIFAACLVFFTWAGNVLRSCVPVCICACVCKRVPVCCVRVCALLRVYAFCVCVHMWEWACETQSLHAHSRSRRWFKLKPCLDFRNAIQLVWRSSTRMCVCVCVRERECVYVCRLVFQARARTSKSLDRVVRAVST